MIVIQYLPRLHQRYLVRRLRSPRQACHRFHVGPAHAVLRMVTLHVAQPLHLAPAYLHRVLWQILSDELLLDLRELVLFLHLLVVWPGLSAFSATSPLPRTLLRAFPSPLIINLLQFPLQLLDLTAFLHVGIDLFRYLVLSTQIVQQV